MREHINQQSCWPIVLLVFQLFAEEADDDLCKKLPKFPCKGSITEELVR